MAARHHSLGFHNVKTIAVFRVIFASISVDVENQKIHFNIVWQVWFGILPEPPMIGADWKRLLF